MERPAALFDHRCVRLLPRCTSPAAAKQAHCQMVTTGLALHSYPLSRLLPLLAGAVGPCYALSVLRRAARPTTFLYNVLISAFASAAPVRAWSLYAELAADRSLRPNSHSFPSLLRLCGPQLGLPLHAQILKFLGNSPDRYVEAALVSFYCRCRRVDLARRLFDRIPRPDLATWNAILSAYGSGGKEDEDLVSSEEAFTLFHRMQLSLTRPNEITMVSLISACASLGALAHGMWLHAYVSRARELRLNHVVATALITMYGRCGQLAMAEQMFDGMPLRDAPSYNAMIQALAVHGEGRRALRLFQGMATAGVSPDGVTFLAAMTACAHAGLVDEGRRCFAAAAAAKEAAVEHYGCLVDLLGRAGLVEEAAEAVRKMPVRPNAAVYRALLAACGTYDELAAGEAAAAPLLRLEPRHGGNYVLLANLYASRERWEDAGRVRKTMEEEGVKKDPGRSYVEIDGGLHAFTRGDRWHPMWREIRAVVEGMRTISEDVWTRSAHARGSGDVALGDV